jgi:hypothetical protein
MYSPIRRRAPSKVDIEPRVEGQLRPSVCESVTSPLSLDPWGCRKNERRSELWRTCFVKAASQRCSCMRTVLGATGPDVRQQVP